VTDGLILTLNAGSSSLKFGLYDTTPEPREHLRGQVDGLGPQARLVLDGAAQPVAAPDHATGLLAILAALAPRIGGAPILGVGHRVVHGGPDLDAPARLTPDLIVRLDALAPLAPLHQPHNLAGIRAAIAAFPQAQQVACFDTAFHRGHPWVNDTFALPRRFYDEGVRRYGFHGLSYDFITGKLASDHPDIAEGPRHRRPSRQRRLALRHPGRALGRLYHGILRARRHAHGHPLRASSTPASSCTSSIGAWVAE
jgi:acetate kinase